MTTHYEVAHPAEEVSLTIALSKDDIDILDVAIDDTLELARDAARIFGLFGYYQASGYIDTDDPAIEAVMRMSKRAVNSMESREFRALAALDSALRSAKAELINARLKGGAA